MSAPPHRTPRPLSVRRTFLANEAAGGTLLMARAAVRLRVAELPADAAWAQICGVSLLCGIGFTMSLFIGGLAFPGPDAQDAVKVGVLAGSLASALIGYLLLRVATPQRVQPH